MTRIHVGDALDVLRGMPAESVQCVVTSPPYWGLRAYRGDDGMIGLEATFDAHLAALVVVFREVRRVLRADGTCWLNYGDAYASKLGGGCERYRPSAERRTDRDTAGLKPKDLMMMPARVALALQADGWWLRSEIVWHKPNPMPESVADRPTNAHEKLYLLTKAPRYFYDAEAVRVPLHPDTVPRYHRGRSDDHKYADGGPGNQTLARSLDYMAGQYAKPYEPGTGKEFNGTGAQDARGTKARIVEAVRNGTLTGAKPPQRLEHRDAQFQRRPLRDVPAGPRRAVHQGRHQRARGLREVRGTVAARGGRAKGVDRSARHARRSSGRLRGWQADGVVVE